MQSEVKDRKERQLRGRKRYLEVGQNLFKWKLSKGDAKGKKVRKEVKGK